MLIAYVLAIWVCNITWTDWYLLYSIMKDLYKEAFKELLPELGKRSFNYHIMVYSIKFQLHIKQLFSNTDNLERWKNYLKFTYKLTEEYDKT
jgi:hypothetical protein